MKYVQNIHTNGILCETGDKTLTKLFPVLAWDKVTGQRLTTGYTAVTEEEIRQFTESCPLFVYFTKKKKLIVHDALPEEAMTPHEALSSARKENGKLAAQIETLTKENAEMREKIMQLEKAKAKAKE